MKCPRHNKELIEVENTFWSGKKCPVTGCLTLISEEAQLKQVTLESFGFSDPVRG